LASDGTSGTVGSGGLAGGEKGEVALAEEEELGTGIGFVDDSPTSTSSSSS
jgi:hypothetical protein